MEIRCLLIIDKCENGMANIDIFLSICPKYYELHKSQNNIFKHEVKNSQKYNYKWYENHLLFVYIMVDLHYYWLSYHF